METTTTARRFDPKTIVAFDCETHLIRPGLLAPPLVCATFAEWKSDYGRETGARRRPIYHRSERASLIGRLGWAFDNASIIVGANTPFDAAVCMEYAPELLVPILCAYEEGRVLDVQVNEKLSDIARGRLGGGKDGNGVFSRRSYALADLSKRYLGKDRSVEKSDPMGWRMRYAELHDVPLSQWPDAAVAYAIEDADDTLDVLLEQLKDHVWQPDAAARARTYLSLHLMSCHGIKTDPEAIDALERATASRFRSLTEELMRHGLVRSNGSRDTKKAKSRLVSIYRNNGIPVPLTDTGEQQVRAALKLLKEEHGLSRDELADARRHAVDELADSYASLDEESCEGTGDALLEHYAERTRLQTIVETHIPDLRKGVDTPIQSRWDMAESGRVTCSKGRGGSTNGYQLTNPLRALMLTCPFCEGAPHEGAECAHCKAKGEIQGPGVRECFRARPGYVLVDADFSGLELCTVAQACKVLVGWSDLGDALNAGVDVHLDFGAHILGITYEEAVRRKHDKDVKEARQLAKPGNFGFWGGLGGEGFAAFARGYGIKITADRGRELKDLFSTRWTEYPHYLDHIRGLTEEHGLAAEVVQLYSGRVRGLVPYTAACNTYFQGLGADGATAALWDVTIRTFADVDSPLYGCRVVNFVHDQILMEAPIERAHECAVELGRVMVEACNRYLPDYPVKCEPCLSYAWHKDAVAVYDSPGAAAMLVPWDEAKRTKARVWYADGTEVVW